MSELNAYHLLVVLLASSVLVVVAHEFGRLVRRRSRMPADSHVQTLVASVLGMLALLIGFTFSMALAEFETRRAAILDEANAIGTTALRASLLPEPHASSVQALLRRYVDLRLEMGGASRVAGDLVPFLERSNALQAELWRAVEGLAAADPALVPTGLFIQALNDTFDAQERRLAAFRRHIPNEALVVLYGIVGVAVALVGYASGSGTRWRSAPNYVVGLLVLIVIVFIQDLDDPLRGFIRVDQTPLIDVATGLHGP